ncbi:MAG: hypothetical protein ACRDXB_20040 [Actinomycetes bacterium]
MTVEFVEKLPGSPRGGRPVANAGFAAALRERPGEWAVWPKPITVQTMRVYRRSIPRGILRAFHGGGFEAAVREGRLYVRYVGGAQ